MIATPERDGMVHDAEMQTLPRDRQAVVDVLEASIKRWAGSVSSLAREAGVSPSTITRFLKDPHTVAIPKRATINKIVNVVDPGGQDTNQKPSTDQPGVFSVQMAGEIRVGVWVESADDLDYGPPVVVDLGSDGFQALSAYRVSSPEATAGRWPDGTLLIVEATQIPSLSHPGIYRRIRGDLVETTYREYVRRDGQGFTRTPPRTLGGEWTEAAWVDPFRTERAPDDDIDAFMGRIVGAMWRA